MMNGLGMRIRDAHRERSVAGSLVAREADAVAQHCCGQEPSKAEAAVKAGLAQEK